MMSFLWYKLSGFLSFRCRELFSFSFVKINELQFLFSLIDKLKKATIKICFRSILIVYKTNAFSCPPFGNFMGGHGPGGPSLGFATGS